MEWESSQHKVIDRLKAVCGEELSSEELQENAAALCAFFDLLLQIDAQDREKKE